MGAPTARRTASDKKKCEVSNFWSKRWCLCIRCAGRSCAWNECCVHMFVNIYLYYMNGVPLTYWFGFKTSRCIGRFTNLHMFAVLLLFVFNLFFLGFLFMSQLVFFLFFFLSVLLKSSLSIITVILSTSMLCFLSYSLLSTTSRWALCQSLLF